MVENKSYPKNLANKDGLFIVRNSEYLELDKDTLENAESAINIKKQSNEVAELIKKSTESTMNLEREVKKFIV